MNQADLDFITSVVGPDRVSVNQADLEAHSRDESFHEEHPPDLVVWPESAEEISRILRWANEQRVAVIPWGGGSSLEGNPIPVRGGILLALYNMNQVLEISPEDLQVQVQPGIIYDELNKQLARHGLFFPPAPGSSDVATIGGMVANNSGGMHALKYGVTRDYVLKLEVVLPTGEIVHLGCNAFKSSSGYDLTRLFVGSEGTLGVATEVTLRLRGIPENKMAAVAVFGTMKQAATAIFDIIRFGLTPAALELMDPQIVGLVNRWRELSLQEKPTLVMEFHGGPATVQEEADFVKEVCTENGCEEFQVEASVEERDRLWEGRREAHNAVKYLNPDCLSIIGDIAVPISKFPEAVETSYEIGGKHDIRVVTFGHGGDGNVHTEIIFPRDDEDARRRAELVSEELVHFAIGVGGTATGEHGVGIGKRKYMPLEHGPSLEVMRRIKRLLDPNGIMNPGKIFEDGQSPTPSPFHQGYASSAR